MKNNLSDRQYKTKKKIQMNSKSNFKFATQTQRTMEHIEIAVFFILKRAVVGMDWF